MKISKGQRVVISGGIILLSLVLKQLNFYLGISNILLIAALVTLAVIGAIFIGEYFEAAAVTFLFMLGNYLESKTLEKTRSAIRALLDLAPYTARVLRDDDEI